MDKKNMLKKEEILKLLDELEKSPKPPVKMPSAMCYDMALPEDRAEYICPVCAEKTLYANTDISAAVLDIPTCRSHISELQNYIDISLDEKSFCKKCSPTVKAPSLAVIIKYPDNGEHREEGIKADDLYLLIKFLSGNKARSDIPADLFEDLTAETPLAYKINRIKELLGLDGK